MTVKTQRSAWAGALLVALGATACANEPYPDQPSKREVADELYSFLCKRVARETDDVRNADLSGIKYTQLCDAPPDDLDDEPLVADQPRLKAMLVRRQAIVDAIAQTIGDLPVNEGASFEEDELKDFLNSLVPFYDDLRLPTVSRKLAELLRLVVDEGDPRAVAVIDQLSKISPRIGYRVAERALGAVRPFLTYPELDSLSRVLLALFGEGGEAHDEFVALLQATTLEMADDAEPKTDGPDNTTLHLVLDLLLGEDQALAEGGGKQWAVRRDTRGYALATKGSPFVDEDGDGLADLDAEDRFVVDGSGADRSPWPFVKARGADPVGDRDGEGRALNAAGEPMFSYFDANATVLAAGMREAKGLIERTQSGTPSTIENASRGLRPMLGPNTQRTYDFKKPFTFQGPDLSKSPALDLLHAVTELLKQPETRDALELVFELMKQDANESTAAGPIFAALGIDRRSDDPKHNDAKLVGYDGTPNTPSEWWDEAIATAVRILKRPALMEALITSFADPRSGAQGQLYATWMKHNDVVTYLNAPFEADATSGKFTEQQAKDLNAVRADYKYVSEVNRQAPNTGMNRSVWQRTMSMLHTINGTPLCNKEGATVSVPQIPFGPVGGPYAKCAFVEIPDPGEAYVKATLKRFEVKLKDEGLKGLAALGQAIGLTGSTAEIQESESQIVGFNDKPTPESMARLLFAPHAAFTKNLFGDILTNDNVPVKLYEPYALFPLEVQDPLSTVDGQAQSFITAGVPLVTAFDDNELRDGEKLLDGYMFGHFLNTFHMHWSAPQPALCPEAVVVGESEGCTQSVDVTKKFWSYQSNLQSYEPLLVESFADEKLTQILQKASAQLQTLTIRGKKGSKVLADFAAMLLRQNDIAGEGGVKYRDGRRYSLTNSCAPSDSMTPPEKCGCPAGSTEEGDNCKVGERIFPRGKVLGASPLYILLDALKGIDKMWESDKERQEAWLRARSELVDRFLASEPVAGQDLTFRFKNQRARKIAVKAIEWANARIDSHQGDLASWADGLVGRTEKVLSHPMVARGLDVLDVFWNDKEAGDQFAAVAAYLMDAEQFPDAFSGIIVAVADTLTFLDREPNLTPIVQFASLAVAPDAFTALDDGAEPDVENGVLLKGLELTKDIVDLHEGDEPSAISKVLKNLVLANDSGESPLEVFFDSIAEINRNNPSVDADVPMAPADASGSLNRAQEFLSDGDRGLERIYKVIQSRNLNSQPPSDTN
ncbi:MAG: hypothetical protein ABW352_17380 [Polyangiales bacterium]